MDHKWGSDGPEEAIRSVGDVLRMLDGMLKDEEKYWDSFYADRERRVPFFVNAPDESLVEWFQDGTLKPGRVLELGCGPGRNAIYMARNGCRVDAVDISHIAIDWAVERAAEAGVEVEFRCESIFDVDLTDGEYDIVYDCGCFHHIPPHRRISFVPLLKRLLKPGGMLGITCMGAAPPEENGGCDITDWQVYYDRSMHGGLGYSENRLRSIFEEAFELVELRRMRKREPDSGLFGEPFLWVGLFKRRPW